MAIAVNKDYIINISHTPSNRLRPVRADNFIQAIHANYGAEKGRATIGWLTSEENAKSFSGMAAFQDRLITAMYNNGEISVDDQKYIADIAFRVFNGSISLKK